ncbi:hypothetical protein I549_3314 [Mycobacterium avium subsp. avium 2285 (R)]|nr:hypothetical protein I549_3314 [Mycobacterium avium subsp. avium 2285 (R)]
MPPLLAATAAAQREGSLGLEQVAVIRKFCHQLPGWIDQATRERAEADLANQGTRYRPNSSPRWPARWPIASTPTASTATKTAPAAAASPWTTNTPTACPNSAAG